MRPTKKAERPAKRNLVRWSDDLDKQVLLTVQYACNEAGVRIPWDDVARLMCEVTGENKFTGGAIIQHLSKLRSKMESHELRVPPPLKRGLIVNAPSKIYAAGNKSKGGKSKTKSPKSSAGKPKKSKARKFKSEDEDEDESEGIPVLYDDYDDDEDDSDGEYGSAKKKRRLSSGKGKIGRQSATVADNEEDKDVKNPKVEAPMTKVEAGKGSALEANAEIQESVESPSPGAIARTRGVKQNYEKTDPDSIENGDGEDVVQAEEEVKGEEHVQEQIKSDRDISPYTKGETYVANAPGFVNLTSDSTEGYPETRFGLDLGSAYDFSQAYGQHLTYPAQQYQVSAQADFGFPHSNGTSFSTNRTSSMASLASSMAPPPAAYINHGSYAPLMNNEVITSNFVNDDIMYGDQYIPHVSYPPSSFHGSFKDPFSGADGDDEKGDYV